MSLQLPCQIYNIWTAVHLYWCTCASLSFQHLKKKKKSLRSNWLKHTHLTLQTPHPHPRRIMRGPSQQGQRQELGVQTGWAPNPTLQAAACKMAVLLLSDGLLPRQNRYVKCTDPHPRGSRHTVVIWRGLAAFGQCRPKSYKVFLETTKSSQEYNPIFATALAAKRVPLVLRSQTRGMPGIWRQWGEGGGGWWWLSTLPLGGEGGNKDYIQRLWVCGSYPRIHE